MIQLGYIIFIAISFLVSLTIYFQPDTRLYLRLFPLFLLLTLAIEIISYYLSIYTKLGTDTVTGMYNFFTSFEFLFYMYVIREIIQSKRAKKIVLYISGLYLLLVILNFLFIQKISSFNSLTYALGCLLIGAICIYYVYELFQSSHSVSLVRQPSFWICSGLLFYYCCSFPIYGLLSFLKEAPLVIRNNFRVIILLLNVFLYSSFTIAFLCRIRVRKSMS
jgi:hypothetical protein